MYKPILIASLMLAALVGAEVRTANACTVAPVNATAQKNELAAQALNEIGVSIEDVRSIGVTDYSGDYIWTPMCPKGLTSQATFTIGFNSVADPLTKGCTAVVAVSKTFIYEERTPRYEIELVQAPVCLE